MTQMTLDQAIALGWQHKQAGRLAEAEAIARQILHVQPNQPQALHLLGAIGSQIGRAAEAIELLQKAITLEPGYVDAYNDLAIAHTIAGQFPQAVETFRRALALRPDAASLHYNLACTYRASGDIDQAIASFRDAIAHRPAYPDALSNLGLLLRDTGKPHEAIVAFREALKHRKDSPPTHYNLALALKDIGDVEQSIAHLRAAIAQAPNFAEAMNNLGLLLQETDRLDEANDLLNRAAVLAPADPRVHYNLGNVLHAKGDVSGASSQYQKAIALQPDYSIAHHNLGLTLLLRGEFARGWDEYEWRWRARELGHSLPDFRQPMWQGEPLNGRRILLHAEQGLGDAIHFVRYAPVVAEQGGRVILHCKPELSRLFKLVPGVEAVVDSLRLPDFDVHCPLMSLPRALGTTLQTIPADVPYLHAEPGQSKTWRKRLEDIPGLKVGIAWAGKPLHRDDRKRSMASDLLAPLHQLSRVRFISLQKEQGNPPFPLLDWTSELTDFAETAALIANLDLVITVDTSVAHLAGAMGRPVWVMLPFVPDWRWMLGRSDSPWYPTMRLFRQPTRGDWQGAVEQVAKDLEKLAKPG